MTADRLRARKRELLARKKYELALQAAGRGDSLALFMVNEELLDVNAQLRALTPHRRVGASSGGADGWAMDRQQYLNWRREEPEEGRAGLRQMAVRGMDLLPPRQREVLALHLEGKSEAEIAGTLGVGRSTVCRSLARAKSRVRRETERAITAEKCSGCCIDLADPEMAKAVLRVLTPTQMVYFYLYYAEWLSLREIGALLGVDHSTILRTLRRALGNIGKLLGEREAVLEHPEALDQLAYQVYCHLEEHPELLPSDAPRPKAYHPGAPQRSHGTPVPASLRGLCISVRGGRRGGRLLSILLERCRTGGGVLRWLAGVFTQLLKGIQRISIRGG